MCTCQDGANQQVHSIHSPPGMASLAAEHKEGWRILWDALKIKSLIASYDLSSAEVEKEQMGKKILQRILRNWR